MLCLKDEMTIFERGFSIKPRKGAVRAAWTDIEAIYEQWAHFRKTETSKGVPLIQGRRSILCSFSRRDNHSGESRREDALCTLIAVLLLPQMQASNVEDPASAGYSAPRS